MCCVLEKFTSTLMKRFSLQQKARHVCPQQNFTAGDFEATVWVGAEERYVLGLAICRRVKVNLLGLKTVYSVPLRVYYNFMKYLLKFL